MTDSDETLEGIGTLYRVDYEDGTWDLCRSTSLKEAWDNSRSGVLRVAPATAVDIVKGVVSRKYIPRTLND